MPVTVRKKKDGEMGKPWKIVEEDTDKVVGESSTEEMAKQSAFARNRSQKIKDAKKLGPYDRHY